MAVYKILSDKIKQYASDVDLDSAFQELQDFASAKPPVLSVGDSYMAKAASALMAGIDQGEKNEITSSDAMLFAQVAQAIATAKGNNLLNDELSKNVEKVLFALDVLCEHCGESVSPKKQISKAG